MIKSDHISKALIDNVVDDKEYSLILEELKKYKEMKEEIRKKTNASIDDATRNSLIEQGREEALKKFKETFTKKHGNLKHENQLKFVLKCMFEIYV